MDNIILMTDSYKVSHWKQYPKGTEKVYSYFESRGGKYNQVLFFGLQYIIKKYLTGVVVTKERIEEADKLFGAHLGDTTLFNKEGWQYILDNHGGKLPVEIKAVSEGTLVDTRKVLFTVENTDPKCFWLTSYLETLLEQIWYPCTIATKSYLLKRTINKFLYLTGNDIPDFKLHDFGYRGSTSQESAGIGDAAHLVNFKGTDTIAGIRLLQKYYSADMPAFSIPAAEHSTITSWGKDNEAKAFENMLDQFPTGLVAVVSDSYDIYNACENIWGKELKGKVENRQGTLIIRPDSGDPKVIVPTLLDILGKAFGYSTNEKGFKVLPSFIRLIQGDGIDEDSLPLILVAVATSGWSADNIAFGSGGGLLQDVTRDTLKFAYKCSNITVDGQDFDVYKDPITDPGKVSKKGRFTDTELQLVFKDGDLLVDQTLDEIRKRSEE
jgi:nicotinamide phosphoribosyltransferase